MFTVSCNNDLIWEWPKLIQYLSQNQNQHIQLKINPEAICLHTLGLYDILDAFRFKSVTIKTHNPLESHPVYRIVHLEHTIWFKEQPQHSTNLHTWTTNKVFYICYGRPTAARLGLAGHLYTNHKDISHLHFSATTDPDHLPLFELNKLFTWSTKAAAQSAAMAEYMPLKIANTDNYTRFGYDYADPLTQEYQHCFVDIVVESHVLGNTFFPTEKTARPMWLKKPFIIFASRDYLEYLRQMGFRTFSDFWNEEYDGYEGRERYLRILNLINDLASKSTAELEKMYWDMQYTLDHNYNLLLEQSYNKGIEKI